MSTELLGKLMRPKGDQDTFYEVIDVDVGTETDCTKRDEQGLVERRFKSLEEAVQMWSELNLKEPSRLHKVLEYLPDGSSQEVGTPELSEALINVRSKMQS